MTKRLIRIPEVLNKTGMGRTMLYELIKRGEFPKQYYITERIVAWQESEVDQWIDDRIQQSA